MSKTKQEVFITNNSRETQKLAENFIKRLEEGDVVALYGNLGSGKTTFVQGLVKGLGIKKRIISPTFVFVRHDKVSPPRSPFGHLGGGEGIRPSTPARCNTFYHVDLYRIENQREIKGLGLREIINDGKNTIAIEWAEKIKSLLPKKRWDVRFEDLGENRRKIIVNQKL